MSAVIISDFYRPLIGERRQRSERHYVVAGRVAVVALAGALFLTAVLCFYWQRYTDMPLLEFVLAVMAFAYSGLLGVYATALFTRRGSTASVIAALTAGFVATLAQQSYVVDMLHLPAGWKSHAFPWQLCIGTGIAFLVCVAGNSPAKARGMDGATR